MKKPHIMCVFGTRPDAVKMCPLVLELKRRPELRTTVTLTAQHREKLDAVTEKNWQMLPLYVEFQGAHIISEEE